MSTNRITGCMKLPPDKVRSTTCSRNQTKLLKPKIEHDSPSHDVELSFEDTGSDVASGNVHLGNVAPRSCSHVVTLHGGQMVGSVVPSAHVNRVVDDGHTRT